MKRLLLFMLFILCIGVATAIPEGTVGDWIVDGDKVYIDDEQVYISAEPHTAWNEHVEVSLMTKAYTGNINLLFGFNTDQVTPKYPEYYNPTTETDINGTQYIDYWKELTGITKISRDFNDKDTWYLIQTVPVTAGNERNMRFYMETYNSTKYDIVAYPSIYGSDLVSAYNNGHLYMLDPWTGDPPLSASVYYDFEAGSGIWADDIWGDIGLVSVQGWNATGYDGSSAIFNTNLPRLSNTTFSGFDQTGTMCVFTKFYDLSRRNDMINIYSGGSHGYLLYHNGFDISVYSGADSGDIISFPESGNLINNEWYHICFTFDTVADQYYLYLDGVEMNHTNSSKNPLSNDASIVVGNAFTGTTTYMKGELDEVKLFNAALTQPQISSIYECGLLDCDTTEPINIITSYYNGTVSDNFFTSEDINFTVNNTLNRTCNITLYDRPVEITKTDDNFTICDTGCDYSTYYYNMTHNHTDDPIDRWTFSGNLCHYNPSTSATLTLICGVESESVTIPANELTNCGVGTVFRTANFSICNGTENITIEVTSNALTYNKRLQVYNFTIGEEYVNLTVPLTIDGNSSYLDERIHYHTEGTKQSYVICSDGENDTHNITVTNIEPFLIKNRLDTDCYTEFYNASFDNFTFEYCSSDYVFNDIIQYGSSVYWEYEIYCNDQLLSDGNGTTYSVVQTLDESSVTDFLGSTELECYKNVTIYNLINISDIYYFMIDDTVDPLCTGFSNDTVDELGFYNLEYSCYDQNINSFNLTCGTESDINLSIGTEWYNSSLAITFTENLTCYYSVCDGHPDDFNCIFGNFSIGYTAPVEYGIETNVCPVASTGLSILFSTLCILAFLMLLLGISLNNAIFTTISGIMFIILAFSLYGCSLMIGAVFVFIGIFLLVTGLFRQPYR